jgi:outer membrane protein assembly factor BamB
MAPKRTRKIMRCIYAMAIMSTIGCSDYKFARRGDGSKDPADTASTIEADTGWPDLEDLTCPEYTADAFECGITDACPTTPEGGFTPIVEWAALEGSSCKSQPVIGDLDGDGQPEVVLNAAPIFASQGTLYVLDGKTGATKWERNAQMGYANAPALGDVDGDGSPDIVVVKEYEHSLLAIGSYSVVLYSAEGTVIWESDRFTGDDFDYVAAPAISDMDHDGHPEIVVGRVILNSDGTTRGVGAAGRGSFGLGGVDEGALPAIADLDLDGTEEVIVGNAMYSPDGDPLWVDFTQEDGMVSVANLDDDEAGEFIAVSHNTVRAHDTSGEVMWGPITLPSANITSPAAIGDIDADGLPEIIVAGGNELWAMERDGSIKWTAEVVDESGATGASIFDFEGDGISEVVYIDEQEMVVFDGETGAVKFYSSEHSSPTMYDYPSIADVDGDNQAEIVVCHSGFGPAVSAYGDLDESWAPSRKVWNQHAYSITNVNDDLSIPVDATPNFTTYNSWHSAMAVSDAEALRMDLSGTINNVCEDDCDKGVVVVTYQIFNLSETLFEGPLNVSFYAEHGDTMSLVETIELELSLASGTTTEGITSYLHAEETIGSEGLIMVVDDNGSGTGMVTECSEIDNTDKWGVAICDELSE